MDTDKDGLADFRDQDSDGDGLLDREEGTLDKNGNGVPDFREVIEESGGIAGVGGIITSKEDEAGIESNNQVMNENDDTKQCWPLDNEGGGVICWWIWFLLLLLLCCCLLLVLLCCWLSRRPYILVRVNKAGERGHTKRDEKIIKVTVANEEESLRAVLKSLLKSKRLTANEREQLGKTRYLGLFFGKHGPLVLDGNHKLADYQVEPLTSSNLRGKTRRERRLRKEQATLDVRDALTANPLAEYSPRTKISLMSRMGDQASTEHSLKDSRHVHHLLKTGIGSMHHLSLPNAGASDQATIVGTPISSHDSGIELPAVAHSADDQGETGQGNPRVQDDDTGGRSSGAVVTL